MHQVIVNSLLDESDYLTLSKEMRNEKSHALFVGT